MMLSNIEEAYLTLVKSFVLGKLTPPNFTACERVTEADVEAKIDEITKKFSSELALSKTTIWDVLQLDVKTITSSVNMMGIKDTKYTMCDEAALTNLIELAISIKKNNIKGDFIETGVWRGGACILLRAIVKVLGLEATVWLADSFKGLPRPDPKTSLTDAIWHEILAMVSHLESAEELAHQGFEALNLLDNQVRFLPGWFNESLPTAPIESLALLRLDGDYYESTKTVLEELYPKLSKGGYIIIDDYGLPTDCRKAVNEYRANYNISTEIIKINNQAVYWVKE